MPAGGEAGLEHAVHTAAPARAGGYVYRRHAWPVRVMHWINVVALTVLFMSGLQIFNAHPALNFGKSSYNGVPPVLEIGARLGANGQPQGVTRVLGAEPPPERGGATIVRGSADDAVAQVVAFLSARRLI